MVPTAVVYVIITMIVLCMLPEKGLMDKCRHTTFTVDGPYSGGAGLQLLTLVIVLFTLEQTDEINNRSVSACSRALTINSSLFR